MAKPKFGIKKTSKPNNGVYANGGVLKGKVKKKKHEKHITKHWKKKKHSRDPDINHKSVTPQGQESAIIKKHEGVTSKALIKASAVNDSQYNSSNKQNVDKHKSLHSHHRKTCMKHKKEKKERHGEKEYLQRGSSEKHSHGGSKQVSY